MSQRGYIQANHWLLMLLKNLLVKVGKYREGLHLLSVEDVDEILVRMNDHRDEVNVEELCFERYVTVFGIFQLHHILTTLA